MKFIKLLLKALYKLPIERCTVYNLKFGDGELPNYAKDQLLVCWGFSCTTRLLEKSKALLNFVGPHAKFIIRNVPCVNIEGFSSFEGEFERLLLPGTVLKVLNLSRTNGMLEVQAEFVKFNQVFDFVHPLWPMNPFGTPGMT
jgi:hypothetical protein